VRLVVVTKGQPLDKIQEVIEAGAMRLGENYAEEGVEKIQALGARKGLEWHMIGHVQSRKARLICEHFAWVHSLDSLKLAERLDRLAGELERKLPVLIECNVSGEESKFGYPAWQEERWDELGEAISPIMQCNQLQVRGLMAMAPYSSDPEAARPYFKRARRLRDALARRFPALDWSELSMGMSGDYETAIEEGATIVRIGEAILGPRPG
jgi:pyridoxal phosphate enzyme (YggS family)